MHGLTPWLPWDGWSKIWLSSKSMWVIVLVKPKTLYHLSSGNMFQPAWILPMLRPEVLLQWNWPSRWHGPPWLHQDAASGPLIPLKMLVTHQSWDHQSLDDPPFWLRFSSWNRLSRVFSWALRFPHQNVLPPSGSSPNLTSQEILATQRLLLKASQLETFKRELTMLQKSNKLKGPLKKLTPFLDTEGVLLVGGRISHCSVSSVTLHLIILHQKSWITKLVVRHVHYSKFHPGPATLLTLLSN